MPTSTRLDCCYRKDCFDTTVGRNDCSHRQGNAAGWEKGFVNPQLRTETLWMQEELFPLPPSFLLLLRALVAGGQARLLRGRQSSLWGTPSEAAEVPGGWGTGGQWALTPPKEWGVCGAEGNGGAAIPGLGDACDISLPFTTGDLPCHKGKMKMGCIWFIFFRRQPG